MNKQLREKKRSKMYAHVESFRNSNQGIVAYCRQHSLSRNSLRYWEKHYDREHSDKSPEAFIPIELSNPEKNSSPSIPETYIEIHYPNGVKVRCPFSIDNNQLKTLINLQ